MLFIEVFQGTGDVEDVYSGQHSLFQAKEQNKRPGALQFMERRQSCRADQEYERYHPTGSMQLQLTSATNLLFLFRVGGKGLP